MGFGIVQWRQGTAAAATAANPVLYAGEPGWETDTGRFKIGDGVTAWNSLVYASTKMIPTTGIPANSVGVNGDYAIDSTNSVLYGPKAAGAWPAGVSFKGQQGAKGDPGNPGTPGTPGTSWTTQGTVAAGDLAAFASGTGQVLKKSGRALGYLNAVDLGADNTGAVSIEAAITAGANSFGGAGGLIEFPPGTYLTTSAPFIISQNNITLWAPAGQNTTVLKTNNTTGDQIRLSGYGCRIEGFSIQGPGSGTTSNKTSGIGLDVQSTEGIAKDCSFAFQFDACRIGGHLVDVDSLWVRYFKANGIIVDHQSDHRITRCSMVNNAASLPTGAGIDVRVTASLVMDNLNIIASNWCLNLSPAAGVTIPSVKVTNAFFDTSAIGLRCAGAGSVFRSEFTQCWFSTMTQYGVLFAPTTTGNMVDGITFVNCDIYNNVAGTTVGFAVTTANVGKWKMVGCSIAGWTDGISIVGGPNHYPTILSNTIGAVSAFGVNGTGVRVATGTYKGLVMIGNDVVDNTAAIALGTVTVAAATNFRIIDNPGLNPRTGVELRPVNPPVLTTVYTNTTGFRCNVTVKHGATANTAVVINGVTATMAFTAGQVCSYILSPGGTISFTGGTAPTVWSWTGT